MVPGMVAHISWRLWGTMEVCMPRALQKTHRKWVGTLKYGGIIWHPFVVPKFAVRNAARS